MDINRVDLNLLIHLDVLLREQNVTKAASHLGITQPAMSNGLKRLRLLFEDPLLVRTTDGMAPTELALELKPAVREILFNIEKVIQPDRGFDLDSSRVFRIMASDYAESTLIPSVLNVVRQRAANVTLDILTPSDVSFEDVEQGRVDMAINRFDTLPQSFHQKTIWTDTFSCLMNADNEIANNFTLENYLEASHIWVSKTGFGVGVGMNPKDVQRLGWVDEALNEIGYKRNISVFTRHYQVAMLLAQQHDLIATLPSKAAGITNDSAKLVTKEPPFPIPAFDLKMAWSPLLHHNAGHQWLRRLIVDVANNGMEQK
ncbi:LysR family transcriptional regulator [Alkalimarinus alittae]|uniref:LysR family transcriptional regulator n=1 Tax=Alkalimarinus alittae TaxID=2961619 RepID=A0ABY6MY64_9ALTE|nr:LysR family transcriptional regulator [Alkalimarinus alittae]UZE94783.1 LysR family transcriptional regulator [Alkalimarinus alittae]